MKRSAADEGWDAGASFMAAVYTAAGLMAYLQVGVPILRHDVPRLGIGVEDAEGLEAAEDGLDGGEVLAPKLSLLLAPVAESLGIDLIWFGVMLAINMQTSFMHPPFGFSLFYLRSVAPSRAYRDKMTGETIQPVTSGQIYMGALPFLAIQLAMVAMVIAFPGLVTHYKSDQAVVNPSEIQLDVPMPGNAGDNPFGTPSKPFNADDSLAKPDSSAVDFGSPIPDFGVPQK